MRSKKAAFLLQRPSRTSCDGGADWGLQLPNQQRGFPLPGLILQILLKGWINGRCARNRWGELAWVLTCFLILTCAAFRLSWRCCLGGGQWTASRWISLPQTSNVKIGRRAKTHDCIWLLHWKTPLQYFHGSCYHQTIALLKSITCLKYYFWYPAPSICIHLSHVLNLCVHVKQGAPCKGVA